MILPAVLVLAAPANSVGFVGASMESRNGGGQDARATLARASCPEPSVATPRAILTTLVAPAGAAAIGQLESDFTSPPDAA
jgi:hypothetical protein